MDAPFHVALSDGRIAGIRAETDQLWRYMDLWKLVSMLANRGLYFPVVATLGDQLEAAPLELPEGGLIIEKFQQWHFWRQWCCTFFVSCWHCASHESGAMWEIYAGRNQGIASNSTFQALSDAFDPAGADTPPEHLIRAGLVEYIDPDSKEPMFQHPNGDEHVLRKPKLVCVREGAKGDNRASQ